MLEVKSSAHCALHALLFRPLIDSKSACLAAMNLGLLACVTQ